jgi:hypothetical protein
VFRDGDAADIGYAMVCYPDYAVAKGLNPKLQLIRAKTLMQGDDSCSLFVWEHCGRIVGHSERGQF